MMKLVIPVLFLLGQDLPVRDGLELWLDATALPEGPVSIWPDQSGFKRNLAAADAAPQRIKEGAVRFDGRNNRLTGKWGMELDDLTLIVVFAPHSNGGGFRALFSAGSASANDYESGLNVDFGAFGGDSIASLNVEGRGLPGQSNLLTRPAPLDAMHVAALTSTVGKGATRLLFDGAPAGRRDRSAGRLSFDEIRLGARRYNNEAPNPIDQGFFHGDLAEVLLFRRVLSDDELAKLSEYLRKKHPKAAIVEPPSPVTMLSPGFTVRKLPLRLTNINNVEYAPDGRLFALGYDGRVHVLTDSDGDGLEDTVTTIYEGEGDLRAPIGMALAPEGIYVASKGKLSLIRDHRAETVAQGWKEIPHGVDALGVALDPSGNLFFGLGCHDFTNIYHNYDLKSERGTILKVAPDRKSREIVCTGIRFPVALAFNRHGDLFATDQEGETWCPGGNPLDKIIHIQPGRHYAFPPRDALRLPDVIDEPVTVAFGPQHQSTCGMKFNEGRGRFGPENWEGDALVTGYSRGKLWRVPLTKTRAGYVGRPVQIASLAMLPVDIAVSPKGDLVVSCHSGGPDWGTGPKGQGTLFKISWQPAPQPVAVWASGPMEVRVAFDRPIGKEEAREISFGEYVGAADRLEVFSPPYKAVEEQKRAPRYRLDVVSRALSEDRRTLLLTTKPHPTRASYALSLSQTELLYDLSGVEASWSGEGASWSGWLPHVDPVVVAGQTRGSAEHERFASVLEKPGVLKLRARLELPGKTATLRFGASGAFTARCGTAAASDSSREMTVAMNGEAPELTIEATTGRAFEFDVSYHSDADPHERPVPLQRLRLPWEPTARPPKPSARGAAPELAGGNGARGRALFFGEASCGACHTVRGEGGKAGPDLSNLVHLDPKAVLRDIIDPNATINPDFASYRVVLKDEQILSGIVQTDGPDRIRLIGPNAEPIVIPRSQIRDLRPSSVSLMPEGYKQLGEEKLKDLLTFLTTPQSENPRPPERSRAEVETVLKQTPRSEAGPRALKVLLVANPKDHGENEHDYPAWQKKWKPLLEKVGRTEVATAFPWPTQEQWTAADLAVLYLWGKWDPKQLKEVDAFLARGGGLVALHSAVIPNANPMELAARIGLSWEPGKTKFRHGPLDLDFAAHAITAGLPKSKFIDESYWPLVGDPKGVDILATQVEDGAPRAMAWVREAGKGRVFCTLLGHYTWTFDDPFFRILVLRGMSWTVREPLDRFDQIVSDP
jgi:putative heme-binding domain-containing protein